MGNKVLYKAKLAMFVILAVLSIASTGWSTTYYVDPSGSDAFGNGSQTKPWKSLSSACTKVTTFGDTIHLNAGTYNETAVCPLAVGVSIEGTTTDFSYPNFATSPTAVINAFMATWEPLIYANSTAQGTNGGQEIRFVKFVSDSASGRNKGAVLFRQRSNVRVHNCEFVGFTDPILNVYTYGLQILGRTSTGEPNTYATGVVVHDNKFTNCGSRQTNGSTACLHIGGLEGAKVYRNKIDNQSIIATGIKYASLGYLKGIEIYENDIKGGWNDWRTKTYRFSMELWNVKDESRIHDNVLKGTVDIGGSSYTAPFTYSVKIDNNSITDDITQGVGTSAIAFDDYNEGIIVTGNYIKNLNTGIEIIMNTDNPSTALPEGAKAFWIYKNVFDTIGASNGKALYIQTAYSNQVIQDVRFLNNYVHGGNSLQSGIVIDTIRSSATGFKIINNVFVNAFGPYINFKDGGGSLDATIMNNIVYNSGVIVNQNNVAAIIMSANNTNKPEIIGIGNRPDPYFRPNSPMSNLVNSGVNVGLPYSGMAPDIGTYEYKSTITPTPPRLRVLP